MEQSQVTTKDGIRWHVETWRSSHSQSRHIILLPSGEGDCQSFEQLGLILSTKFDYNITTFDMPGFSRSSAPKEAYSRVTPELYVEQISTLLREMKIPKASFFGSSSGGVAALAMAGLNPELVECSIVHEVPFEAPPSLMQFLTMSDEQISQVCKHLFNNVMVEEENGGREKWAALGDDYHSRLAKNYPTWVHGLFSSIDVGIRRLTEDPSFLRKRPVFWTIGGLNKQSVWQSNIDIAKTAGIEVNQSTLKSLHFPHVTVPEQLATWIDQCVTQAVLKE